jgi:cell division septum initiation protein DivIVA
VNDNQIRARVKAVLGGTSPDSATSEHPLIAVNGPNRTDNALQVLTLAQRTAEEHIAAANRHADKIRLDAQAASDQSARDAQVHAHNVRREADKVLDDARTTAEQAARDARARAEEAQRKADQILADANGQAATIIGDAQGHAEQLKIQAHQRYEDSVGSLIARREALQQQIEALEQFDRDYRARLTTFMQTQLRGLWVDQPQVGHELESEQTEPAAAEAPPAPDGTADTAGATGTEAAAATAAAETVADADGPAAADGTDDAGDAEAEAAADN